MEEETQKPPEMVAQSGLFKGMNTFMGIASVVMILGFVGFTIRDVEVSSAIFAAGKSFIIGTMDWIIGTMDWFYVIVVSVALFFGFWLLTSDQPFWRHQAWQG